MNVRNEQPLQVCLHVAVFACLQAFGKYPGNQNFWGYFVAEMRIEVLIKGNQIIESDYEDACNLFRYSYP